MLLLFSLLWMIFTLISYEAACVFNALSSPVHFFPSDLGFGGGKSKSLYGKEGHLGITIVKYVNTQVGLKEAERLADYFEKDNHGRIGWARAQATPSGGNEENTALVKVDPKSGEKKRILYGYLATASDLEKLDFDTRKRAVLKSRREFDPSE